jgi:hypothetical protein
MERKKKEFKRADAILTADWHLQDTVPICRTDNFQETQWRKVKFISDLQKIHNCPVINAGDLIDFWKPSPDLLSKMILNLPKKFWTIYGNHELPQHNMELFSKSGIFTLNVANSLEVLSCYHWNQKPEDFNFDCSYQGEFAKGIERKVIAWHKMTYQGKLPYPGCTDAPAASLLRKYPQFDLIVTGDNHKPFVEEYEGRLLVNPGSIFRTTADQINHKPRVYLWFADSNTVEPVFIPIEDNVISREHLEIAEQRDLRIDAFISSLNMNWESEASFEQNLQKHFKINKTQQQVMDIIYKSIES